MTDASIARRQFSNLCATAEPKPAQPLPIRLLLCLLTVAPCFANDQALAQQQEPPPTCESGCCSRWLRWAARWSDCCPRGWPPLLRRGLRRRPWRQASRVPRHSVLRDHAPLGSVTSPGVHDLVGGLLGPEATNEWLLTKRPRLRGEHAPFAKGVFAFNVRHVGDVLGRGVRANGTAGARHARHGGVVAALTKRGSARSSSRPRCSIRGATSTPTRAGRCGSRAPRRSGSVLLVLR